MLQNDDGRWFSNTAAVKRSELRAGYRRWLAGVYDPKTYGDKQQVTHSGSIELWLGARLDDAQRFRDAFLAQPIDVTPQNADDTTP